MHIDSVFVSVNARDFAGLSHWYATLLDRRWDDEPMPSCHQWEVAGCVHLQVLDSADGAGNAVVSMMVRDLDRHVARLRNAGVDVPEPTAVEGFDTLRFTQFADPEGNRVGLLEGR